jgi:hypothetical protein
MSRPIALSDQGADIARWADTLGLADRVETVVADGMTIIATRFLTDAAGSAGLVHIDPCDPFAHEPAGLSALELAAQLASRSVKVVYWYGYDTPEDRAWALEWLRRATESSWWCGDMLVTTAAGMTHPGGHLGRATTPGTGFGVVCANLGRAARGRCEQLGHALADAYAGTTLPGGGAGALVFRVVT